MATSVKHYIVNMQQHHTSDLSNVTCPVLTVEIGRLECELTGSSVSCTHSCPSGYYFETNGTLKTSGSVFCNNSMSAQWSHMSADNPLGEFPKCAESITPLFYLTSVTMTFLGSTSCPDLSKTQLALTSYFSSSASDAYSCIKGESPACTINEVKCSSSETSLKITYYINQTGNLGSPVDTFNAQIAADVQSKTFKLSVNTVKRRKRAIDLTADTADVSGPTARCASGAGYVGTICVKCPMGQYEKDGVCTECPVNTYSNAVGSTKCTDCPNSLKTITTGAGSESDCTELCRVPDFANGYSFPAPGYKISNTTVVRTYCNSNYSIQHNVLDTRPCGELDIFKPDFPQCHKMCKVVHISDSMTVTDKSIKVDSLVAYKQSVNFTCDNSTDTETCMMAGQNISLYCDKVSIIILLGIIVGGTILFTISMVLIYFLCCISGERRKQGYKAAVVNPVMSKLDTDLEGIFKGMGEQTYNLPDADDRSDEKETNNTKRESIYCPVPDIANSTIYTTDNKLAPEKVLYTTVLKIACADGFQREGPDKITCQSDKSFDQNVSCVDLNIVTCPTLDAGFGTMSCNTSASPVSCTYTCPSDQYFGFNSTTLASSYEVTCNVSNAEWSHMSSTNPLGDLPPCSEKTTPTSYSLAASIGLSGSDSCIDGLTAALRTALKSSDSAAYNCMDDGQCSVPENAKCNSADGQLSLEFVVQQTGGDLSTSAIIDAFHTQLKADVAAKTFTLQVGLKKRKKRATTLTADGNLVSEAKAGCAAGSGSVGTSCIKCPMGQYEKDGVCTKCAVNTYSDAVGSTKCTECPNSLKTITTGADSESDCTVTCSVESLTNGFRSPTTGYTVPEGTKITTFCNTNYSLAYTVDNKALCNASQPSCYEKCAIVSVDDKTSLKTGTFSYKEGLTYTCSNKADDEIFKLNCDTAGFKFDISCPTSYAAAIAGGVIGVLVVIATIIVVRVIYIRTRPMPALPDKELEHHDEHDSSPESVLGFVSGKIANLSQQLKI
ncbi:hypothetical protein ACHWQZ_G009927 [Mnemiopsis leidyi]